MQNWREYANYRRYKNSDGSFTYIIIIDGENIEVSAAIYKEYAAGDRKIRYSEIELKTDRVLQNANGSAVRDEYGHSVRLPEREVSLDKLISEGWDYPSSEPSPESIVVDSANPVEDELRHYTTFLNDAERTLIDALFYKGLKERECAKMLGISKTALHARKVKVLAKLKKLLEQ